MCLVTCTGGGVSLDKKKTAYAAHYASFPVSAKPVSEFNVLTQPGRQVTSRVIMVSGAFYCTKLSVPAIVLFAETGRFQHLPFNSISF